jgi:hypothetical protein
LDNTRAIELPPQRAITYDCIKRQKDPELQRVLVEASDPAEWQSIGILMFCDGNVETQKWVCRQLAAKPGLWKPLSKSIIQSYSYDPVLQMYVVATGLKPCCCVCSSANWGLRHVRNNPLARDMAYFVLHPDRFDPEVIVIHRNDDDFQVLYMLRATPKQVSDNYGDIRRILCSKARQIAEEKLNDYLIAEEIARKNLTQMSAAITPSNSNDNIAGQTRETEPISIYTELDIKKGEIDKEPREPLENIYNPEYSDYRGLP